MKTQPGQATIQQALTVGLGLDFQEGNEINLLRNGDNIFPPMLRAIEEATETVEFVSHIFGQGGIVDRFCDVLARKAKQQVQVRVLLDAVGAHDLDEDRIREMRDAGVEVRWFRPVWSLDLRKNAHRTHLKILVCDGQVAFTGGVGIASEWEGNARGPNEWRETHMQIEGPAVDPMRASFLAGWLEAGGNMLETDLTRSSTPLENGSLVQVISKPSVWGEWSSVMTAFVICLRLARNRVRITTAYFVPGDVMCSELIAARRRGVSIEVLIPGIHTDQRLVQQAGEARYGELLKEGVTFWRYRPTMIHSKVMTIDEALASVGSANFNQRSMLHDEEIVLNIADARVVRELDKHFEEDVSNSDQYTEAEWADRSLWQRLKEKGSALLSNHM